MRRRTAASRTALLALVALGSVLVVYGKNERCLRAEVPAPIVFPDGTTQPAGALMLCVADYSPVASYHRVFVNGMPKGLLFSHRTLAESPEGPEPRLLFRSTDSGALRLLGYIWPSGKKANAYLLQSEPWDARVQNVIPARESPPYTDAASRADAP